MGTRLLKLVVAAAVACGLLVVAWPQFFGLERTMPFAQIVSFRLGCAIVAVLAVSVVAVLAIFARPARTLIAVIAGLGLVFALGLVTIQAARGYASADPRPERLADIRVLSWNVLRDGVSAETIGALAAQERTDVIALQEVSPDTAQAVAAILAQNGRSMTVLSIPGAAEAVNGTALLIASELGEYTIDPGARLTEALPSVVARPTQVGRPVLVSAHAAPPTGDAVSSWRGDLSRLAAICSGDEDVVVMGDLNSTIDHWAGLGGDEDLGDCIDAGSAAGGAALGTWPASVPSPLGAAIDHTLFAGDWAVSGYRVDTRFDGQGSDHRPIVVQLSVDRMTKEFG